MATPAPYDVLQHLDALERALTPDMPFQMLHLIRACRSLQRERDAYRDALAEAIKRGEVRKDGRHYYAEVNG